MLWIYTALVLGTGMGVEIERRFLVNRALLHVESADYTEIVQGYLTKDPWVRVRIKTHGNVRAAELTIKGKGTLVRSEFNYKIPVDEAEGLLCLVRFGVIHKKRYQAHRWEIDEFLDGDFNGLWLAEIELHREDEPLPSTPDWLGQEVTDDPRYSNAYMAEHGPPGVEVAHGTE
jgi:adenylate cyclase